MNTLLLLRALAALLLLSISSTALWAAAAWQEHSVDIGEQELAIKRFASEGAQLVLWIGPGIGLPEREYALAAALAKRGVEVWHVDLLEALFLPRSASAMRRLEGRYVAGMITAAHAETGKQITVLSRAGGSLVALRGARYWQQSFFSAQPTVPAYFSGAILFSPELHSEVAELGLDAVYDPIASASNIPIMLYQAGKRGNRWQLEKTVAQLESGGAAVYVKILPGITGVFYDGDDAAATQDLLAALPDELVRVLAVLAKTPVSGNTQVLAEHVTDVKTHLDTRLMPFRGQPWPLALDLESSQGKPFKRDHYRGKVTVVNFWASWCGPCVEEIPSLNNLREKMQGRRFELISVNYAEDPQRVAEFLKQVRVDFPVLLDKEGRVAAAWNVLVFPATFIIGPDGKIIYGVNGAIYWDSPDVLKKLENLLRQAG